MRYRLMASYRGVPYEAGVGPAGADVVLFAACPPPEELGFEPAPGHWRKRVVRAEVDALWESRPVGVFRGEPCMVLDDLGERMHIAYFGTDAGRAAQLGYWQVDRGVFELLTPRDEVTGLTEERVERPLRWNAPHTGPLPAYPYGTAPWPVQPAPPASSPPAPQPSGYPPVPAGLAPYPGPGGGWDQESASPPGLNGAGHNGHSGLSPAGANGAPSGLDGGPGLNGGPSLNGGTPSSNGIPGVNGGGPALNGPRLPAPPLPPPAVTGPIPAVPAPAAPPPWTGPIPAVPAGPAFPALGPDPYGLPAAWDGSPGGTVPPPRDSTGSHAVPLARAVAAGHAAATAAQQAGLAAGLPPASTGSYQVPFPGFSPGGSPAAYSGPQAPSIPGQGGRSGRRQRVPTRAIFCELADLAAIPRHAYALEAETDGAMCLLHTGSGYEVFVAAEGARLEARTFDDEEAAYFYLFGVLAAEAVRNGGLAPMPGG